MSRVVALDYGEARCGCAVSDPTGTLATPLAAVERPDTRRGLDRIVRLVHEHEADRVVIGLPVTLEGHEGHQARRTRRWAEEVAQRVTVLVVLHDERLTTREAERRGGDADVDSRSAAVLLESYLAVAARTGAQS